MRGLSLPLRSRKPEENKERKMRDLSLPLKISEDGGKQRTEDEGFKPSAEDLRRRRKIKNGRKRILSLQPEKDEGRKPKMKAKVVNL
jgi:hypothetical protein